MKLVKPLNARYQEITREAKETQDRLIQRLSGLDRVISNINHELERIDLTPESGYYAALLLQDILRKRRVIKDEINGLDSLVSILVKAQADIDNRMKNSEKRYRRWHRELNIRLEIEDVGL